MVMFNSYGSHYQRVYHHIFHEISIESPLNPHEISRKPSGKSSKHGSESKMTFRAFSLSLSANESSSLSKKVMNRSSMGSLKFSPEKVGYFLKFRPETYKVGPPSYKMVYKPH